MSNPRNNAKKAMEIAAPTTASQEMNEILGAVNDASPVIEPETPSELPLTETVEDIVDVTTIHADEAETIEVLELPVYRDGNQFVLTQEGENQLFAFLFRTPDGDIDRHHKDATFMKQTRMFLHVLQTSVVTGDYSHPKIEAYLEGIREEYSQDNTEQKLDTIIQDSVSAICEALVDVPKDQKQLILEKFAEKLKVA